MRETEDHHFAGFIEQVPPCLVGPKCEALDGKVDVGDQDGGLNPVM
jgi:hypothetical protein